MIIKCSGEELELNKEKAIYWAAKRMLIISDLHIGKSAHFRKYGIPVPATIGAHDLQRLGSLIKLYNPDVVLITGDMFHNKLNSDVLLFEAWRNEHQAVKFILVKGNHDALSNEAYTNLGIEVVRKELLLAPFRFIHDKPTEFDEYFNITGHIHPGVTIYGKARQQLRFPCFYFSPTCAVMPAFSAFTGLSKIHREAGDQFYAITPSEVLAV
ncbi:MAG: phosphoesterase [Pedobacter sp.]|jgi:DNA ligase-associated metallophosphoesterase|nr:phosphoesterase [Pedobacter sp.]